MLASTFYRCLYKSLLTKGGASKAYTFGSRTADISTPTNSRKCYTETGGAVSVPAGVTYSKNGAAFVSTAGTLVAGDYVIVRFTSSGLYETELSKDITMPVGVLAFVVTTIVEPPAELIMDSDLVMDADTVMS